MQLESVTPSQLSYTDIRIINQHGSSAFYFLPLDTYGWVFPVVTGTSYVVMKEVFHSALDGGRNPMVLSL